MSNNAKTYRLSVGLDAEVVERDCEICDSVEVDRVERRLATEA